uniref:Nitrogen permease regulator 3 n=1 Tax=Alexandrium monilatum TaxID=311494 RepID=A0A7S4RNU7_9DINO
MAQGPFLTAPGFAVYSQAHVGCTCMDSLLGVVFVAQLPAKQPGVVLVYPSTPQDAVEDPGEEDMPQGSPRSPIVEDPGTIFGIPAPIFAKMALPDEVLCNRPFYLEIDGGRRLTSHVHDEFSHLHFVSFPCNASELSRVNTPPQEGEELDPLDPRDRVQRFNIVHVLDSRRASRTETHTSTLWQVSADLARALMSEEARVGYLSKEIRRLGAASQWDSRLHSQAECLPEQRRRLTLEQLIENMFEGLHRRGHRSLRVNGTILCHVCVFPKLEDPAPPMADQALVLTCSRKELELEMPMDSADIVRRVIDSVSPVVSLRELMVRLALPLSTLQRVSQRLVYLKKARVMDVFRPNTRVAVASGVNMIGFALASKRFHDWQKQRKAKEPNFFKVAEASRGGCTLRSLQEQLCPDTEDFSKVLEWFVAEGIVAQLASYYHFLPSRARSSASTSSGVRVNGTIHSEFCPDRLSEDELQLLATRAKDDQQHRFLCLFVVDFARAHRRADGCEFEALVASSFEHSGEQTEAKTVIEQNSDIFVPYVCTC